MESLSLNPMVFYPRFLHIIEKIFVQLDDEILGSSREVTKSWKDFIDATNLKWIQIVKIPKMMKKGDKYLHLAARTGESKLLEMILQMGDFKSLKNGCGKTPLHLVCQYGHFKMTQNIIQNSSKFNFDLNGKDHNGWTSFHWACINRQVKLLVQNFTIRWQSPKCQLNF